MTPHIAAEKGEIAESILLPGDPLRAKFIAENFLSNVRQINGVRNMLGYTGEHDGKEVSVMGTGMGIPSMSIYVTELVKFYGVKNLIRVGSCGGVSDEVKIRDLVIAVGAGTDSGVNRVRFGGMDFSATADYELLSGSVEAARKLGLDPKVGNIFSADLFYHPDEGMVETLDKMGTLAIEMEAAGFYGIAAEYHQLGVKALAICTVSDHLKTGESLPASERESSFGEMMEVALETISSLK